MDSDNLAVVNATFKDNFARVHEDIRHLSVIVRNLDQRMDHVEGHIYILTSCCRRSKTSNYATALEAEWRDKHLETAPLPSGQG